MEDIEVKDSTREFLGAYESSGEILCSSSAKPEPSLNVYLNKSFH